MIVVSERFIDRLFSYAQGNCSKLSHICSCGFDNLREARFDGGFHSRRFKRFRIYETASNETDMEDGPYLLSAEAV